MSNVPRLSICIPTYNRIDYLLKTLDAITLQANEHIEIVISNNGSTDTTITQVNQYIAQHSAVNIRLINQEKNIGFDRNVLSVVDHAAGDYCWLVSDDDIVLPGSLNTILHILSTNEKLSVVVVNYSRFDKAKQAITADRMINLAQDYSSNDPDAFYFLPTPKSYFYVLGTNMITMSINLFKRSYWKEILPETKQFIDLNFIHIFNLMLMMRRYPQLYCIAQPQIQYLSNNHRVWDNDIWTDYKKRFLPYLIDLGYDATLVGQIQHSSINRRTLLEKIYQLKPVQLYWNKLSTIVQKFKMLINR
jgi:glycosyltransferase domain-containing protein